MDELLVRVASTVYITITNQSNITVYLSYPEMVCMFNQGEYGSDFTPISGYLPPTYTLPYNATSQLIVASNAIGCKVQASSFILQIEDTQNGNYLLKIVEDSGIWTVSAANQFNQLSKIITANGVYGKENTTNIIKIYIQNISTPL